MAYVPRPKSESSLVLRFVCLLVAEEKSRQKERGEEKGKPWGILNTHSPREIKYNKKGNEA